MSQIRLRLESLISTLNQIQLSIFIFSYMLKDSGFGHKVPIHEGLGILHRQDADCSIYIGNDTEKRKERKESGKIRHDHESHLHVKRSESVIYKLAKDGGLVSEETGKNHGLNATDPVHNQSVF